MINQHRGRGKLSFSYSRTQDILLSVNSKGASLHFSIGKNYLNNVEHSYLYNLIKEGIKRAALLYLLQYQKPLDIRNITLTAIQRKQNLGSVDLTNSLTFYQMFDGKLLRPLSGEWKDSGFQQRILDYRKSGNELSRPLSALYAYLFSKTKTKETERFSYLWIAMNGFFASVSPNYNDRDAMTAFLKKYDLGNTMLTKKERDNFCKSAVFELMKIPEPVTADNLEDEAHKAFSDYIREKAAEYDSNTFDASPYGFLLTDFPYYLRCTLFHAVHPLELFNFENDWELKSLRIVNGLLEEFLDKNLHTLFVN